MPKEKAQTAASSANEVQPSDERYNTSIHPMSTKTPQSVSGVLAHIGKYSSLKAGQRAVSTSTPSHLSRNDGTSSLPPQSTAFANRPNRGNTANREHPTETKNIPHGNRGPPGVHGQGNRTGAFRFSPYGTDGGGRFGKGREDRQ